MLSLLLLHGSRRSHERPVKEPNVALGVEFVAHLHTPLVLGLRSLLPQTPGAARGGVPPP
jgi:hypothetical protein